MFLFRKQAEPVVQAVFALLLPRYVRYDPGEYFVWAAYVGGVPLRR